jgi:hypothetical protein
VPSGEGDTVGFAKVAILFSKDDMKFRFLAACAFFETTSLRLRTVVVCNKKVPRMHQENAFGAAYHWIIKRFLA